MSRAAGIEASAVTRETRLDAGVDHVNDGRLAYDLDASRRRVETLQLSR